MRAKLTIAIDVSLKKALATYCEKYGLEIQSVVENAIYEWLEDEQDLTAFAERKNEAEIPFAVAVGTKLRS